MRSVEELESRLSSPRPDLVGDLRQLDGDLLVLGAAGKLGPSLVRLAVRGLAEAGRDSRVIAVSRFSDPGAADAMRATGAEVLPADITDDRQLAALPDAANVIYLVGAKFGSYGAEATTWATNTFLPGKVAERFADSRIAALSTGNVYPFWPTDSPGPTESDPPDPVGEYAMSCLGRERVLTYHAERNHTPMSLLRLNYAVEMRYGVLVDIAHTVYAGEPVDLTTGRANVIWQGYANEVTLRSLLHASVPPYVLNVTGADTISIRHTAERFGELFGTEVRFTGTEASTALLSNATACHTTFGPPDVDTDELIEHTARWIADGNPLHGKPTKFQSRDGRF